jgi:hypothetical protein
MSQELLGAESHNKALGASPENQKIRFLQQASIDANRQVTHRRQSKYPPAEPVALRLLAPQRGLFATVLSKSKNKSKSLVLLS